MSHSLTNPFSGGSPEMAIAPIRKQNAVTGMRRIRPPILPCCACPVACSTAPRPEREGT